MVRRPKPETEIVQITAPKNSIYLSVIEGVLRDHYSPREMAVQLNISERSVKGILARVKQRAKRMVGDNWVDALVQGSKEVLIEGVASPTGLTPEQYNQNKISQGNLKGLGVFRVGESPPPVNPGNTTIFQNVQILVGMSEEEREALRETYRRESLPGTTKGHRTVRCLGVGVEEDQNGAAVVGEELHEDV